MFDTEKIKQFINYDWKNMLDKTVPKNKKGTLNNEEFDTIKIGSIWMLVSSIIITLCGIFIAASFATSFLKEIDIFGIKSSINLSSDFFSFSIMPIIILVFIYVVKDKEHITIIEFVAGIILLISGISTIFSLIGWIIAMFINPVWALLAIIFELSFMYGIILVLNGIIPFLIRTNEIEEPKKKTKETKAKEETKNNYCSNCGTKITGKFCTNCGKKVK